MNLKTKRVADIDVDALVETSGVSRQTLKQVFDGSSELWPSKKILAAIAYALEVQIRDVEEFLLTLGKNRPEES